MISVAMMTLTDEVSMFYKSAGVSPAGVVGVALSGGADSVCLLAASVAAGVRCVALHCNFHLRGSESMRDEAFAAHVAGQLGCDFLKVDFHAAGKDRAAGESEEMACRRLRYDWFDRLLASGVVDWIALGHHAADNVETFFLNVCRSAGLRGLCGIPRVRERFLRPLLYVPKREILGYLADRGLDFVVDSTNLESGCARNVWRNELLPAIESKFPDFGNAVGRVMRNLNSDQQLLDSLVDEKLTEIVKADGTIRLAPVMAHAHGLTLLWHAMNRCGDYPREAARGVLEAYAGGRSGKIFRSASGHGFELHRGELIPMASEARPVNGDSDAADVHIDGELIEKGGVMEWPLHLKFEVVGPENFRPTANASVLWLDVDAVLATERPLELRRWRRGDRISPFGMRGSKLVSDIYSDAHLSLEQKRAQWLMVCGHRVLWLPGLRCSAVFPVGHATRKILKIALADGPDNALNKI